MNDLISSASNPIPISEVAEQAAAATNPPVVHIALAIPVERIVNALIGAFEGGSNYWLRRAEYVTSKEGYESPAYADATFWVAGGRMKLTYDNPEEGEDQATTEISLSFIANGLSIMALKSPRHFADLISENDDAITHDVLIQYVLFGDIIYG